MIITVRGCCVWQFFWFQDMQVDEAIILKIYDSLAAGATPPASNDASAVLPRARWTLHTAFDHPGHSFADGTAHGPRESCEVRCLVLWAPPALAEKAELRGVTGLAGGDLYFDPKKRAYTAEKDGASAIMREGYDGSRDDMYAKFRRVAVKQL